MEDHSQKNTEKIMDFLINKISDKFNANTLKPLIDQVFNLSEKIIIHLPALLPSYIKYYQDIIEKEIKAANIDSSSKILHIGCGSIPASSILLAKKTHAHLLCIDKDAHAIQNAKTCIDIMGASNHIEVQNTDASTKNLKPYRVILISQGITPKKEVLETIAKHLSPDQIILLRSFSQQNTLHSSDQFLKNQYQIRGILSHKNHGSTTSIVLQKKTTP
jgi:precorrin-6B methylase 2